jgi:hypothetical protein
VKGISLFLAPKYLESGERNDVALVGLNHKMGYRGTVNTVLDLGGGAHRPQCAPGAVGYLAGTPGAGLECMFHMMNEARIGVGAGAAALAYTGYAEGALALVLYCGLLVDDWYTAPAEADRARARLLLEVLTPIAKSWPSQWGLEANSLAIQVHGGYGYTREYDVEQHYRDNRLNPIHEGTHGIQAIDLLGRKVVMGGGAGFRALREVIGATVERAADAGGEAAMLAASLRDRLGRLVDVTAALAAHPDAEERLAGASLYLEAAGHVVVAWIWLEQFLAAAERDDDLGHGNRQAARYFFCYELPKVGPQLNLLAAFDRTCLDMDIAWL